MDGALERWIREGIGGADSGAAGLEKVWFATTASAAGGRRAAGSKGFAKGTRGARNSATPAGADSIREKYERRFTT
jgi:hypothetical protein